MNLRLVTYNMHKGHSHPISEWIRLLKFLRMRGSFSEFSSAAAIDQMKQLINATQGDILLIQEITSSPRGGFENQLEFLADSMWPHSSYGKNAVYDEIPYLFKKSSHKGHHHGNALLSRYPIIRNQNYDLSLNPFERRGLLHCTLQVQSKKVEVFCTHLNLREKDRKIQCKMIVEIINDLQKSSVIDPQSPLLLSGDFNDWKNQAFKYLKPLEMNLALSTQEPLKTYPSFFPLLELDKVFYKNINFTSAQIPKENHWNTLSDHLPLIVDFNIT